jgi:hypothetical protein
MRPASFTVAALMMAAAGLAPVLAQKTVKTIPVVPQAAPSPSHAERATLYVEDPNDPRGRSMAGSVVWESETISRYGAKEPVYSTKELVITGRAEIPQRQLSMVLTLRHNTDRSLPASHTVDLLFKLPPEAPSDAILNVPGILMKQGENERGDLLAGLAGKVTTGFFLIGLSPEQGERDGNVAMLKERPWIEIPIVFTDNLRGLLALEKGATGNEAFAQTFAEWEK